MSTLMNFLLLKWMNVQYRVQEPGGRRMDFETDQITFYVFDIKKKQQTEFLLTVLQNRLTNHMVNWPTP